MTAKTRAYLTRSLFGAAFLAVLAVPVVATTDVWTWSDRSGLIPFRDNAAISIASGRQNDWLVSDGMRLYRFDGTALRDLTKDARDRGLATIAGIVSDGREWLVHSQSADVAESKLYLTDGQRWTDVSGLFPNAPGGIQAVGHNGAWYVRTFTRATENQPSVWTLYAWNGEGSQPERIELPLSIAQVKSEGAGPFYANGGWYLSGGANGVGAIWKLDGARVKTIDAIPAFKYVSGVWTSKGSALIATSNADSNPFASDRLWTFNGERMTDVSNQARAAGLLSVDAREIRAAWNGKSWMILIGKKLVRFDGADMTQENETLDFFQTVSSNGDGLFLLGGSVSDATTKFAARPLTAKLTTVMESLKAKTPVLVEGLNAVAKTVAFPANRSWSLDAASGIQWLTWTDPNATVMTSGSTLTYSVDAQDNDGLRSIQIYVNGETKPLCAFEKTKTHKTCSVAVRANDYNFGQEVFLNAYVKDVKNRGVWTKGTRVKRSVNAESALPAVDEKPKASLAVFRAEGSLFPNVGDIARGKSIAFRVATQQSSRGLHRVELYFQGNIERVCSFGAVVDPVACDLAIDTTRFAEGTTLSFMAKAVDVDGKDLWSNAKSVTVRPQTYVATAIAKPAGTPNHWAWLLPDVSSLSSGQTAVYSIGAWSGNGIKSIEILADGMVRTHCGYATQVGSKECSYTIAANDWSNGKIVTINARVTDLSGNVAWSEPARVAINRSWQPITGVGAFVAISSNRTAEYKNGERVTFTAKGWSPNQIDRTEIYANGEKVAACHAESCSWTSPALATERIEYQARAVDRSGLDVWSGLAGMTKE